MDDKNGKSPLLAFTVATMLFAALGVMVYNQAPYKGIRPSVQTIPEPPEKIRARLWQDPFQAVLDDLKTRGPKSQQVVIARKDVEAKQSAAKVSQPHDPQILDYQLEDLRKEITDHQQRGNVTALGVMVFGGPYAEMVEFRLGQRYAILSGLNILEYYPEDEEHLRYLRILDTSKGQATWPAGDQENLSNIIPYEWLSSEKEKTSILLLWLNEDIFLEPLTQLTNLQEDLNNLAFKIIGPPSSHSLLELYKELLIKDKEIKPNMTIYLATATADEKGLLQDVFKQYPSQTKDQFNKKYPDFNKEWFKYLLKELKNKTTVKLGPGTGQLENLTSSKIERTILSDRKLATALIDELANRNVDLIQPCLFPSLPSAISGFFGKKYDCFHAKRDHVVLISEWDTLYGRTLPETFKDVIREKLGVPPETEIPWVHRFSYLRGIDGKLPGEKSDSDQEKKKNNASSKEERDIKKLEEPVGKSQYDYLRRLAESISRLNDRLKDEGKGSIKAIGVVGNDFYDKFLVLQALGQKFPDRIFFTTDLDANYFHPANIEWTRNLVVASTYGLQLRDDLQKEVPPFRNAYQTSVFAATLLAFDYPDLKKDDFLPEHLKPRIFEIGRFSAIDLSNQKGSPGPINQAFAVESFPYLGWGGFTLVILIMSILTMFLWSSLLSYNSEQGVMDEVKKSFHKTLTIPGFTKPQNITFVWLVIFAILLSIFMGFHYIITSYPSEEPFSWSEGISIWPTEIIRFAALILSVVFFFLSRWWLNDNVKKIDEDFYLNSASENISPSKFSHTTVHTKWITYLNTSDFIKRKYWVFCISAIYFLLCFIIILLFEFPNNPVRGNFSWWLNIILLFSTIFCFLFLTFFIFDTIMLCQKFISQFYTEQPRWGGTSLEKFVKKWIKEAVPSPEGSHSSSKDPEPWEKDRIKAALSDWMLVLLIARRTDVVGKLIFFPFIVWSLVIISRLHYFDNWRTPLGLAIVISLSAVLAWVYAVNLRRSAEKLRTAVTNRLEREVVSVLATDPGGKDDTNFILHVQKKVEDIKTGAFAPYVQQPALQSLLVPIGGISGLKILELLSSLG